MTIKNLKLKPRDLPVFYLSDKEDACFQKLSLQCNQLSLAKEADMKDRVSSLDSSHYVTVKEGTYIPSSFWSSFLNIGKSAVMKFHRVNSVNASIDKGAIIVSSIERPYLSNSLPSMSKDFVYGVYNSSVSAKKAWEAGYLTTFNPTFWSDIHVNYGDAGKLLQWLTLGQDVTFGTWSCFGALEGVVMSQAPGAVNLLENLDTAWGDRYLHWQNEDSIFNTRDLSTLFHDMQKRVKGNIDIFEAEASQASKLMLMQGVRQDVVELMLNL